MARQHVTAYVVLPLCLGPRPFLETHLCQAESHIEESQGGGSGPIGLIKLYRDVPSARGDVHHVQLCHLGLHQESSAANTRIMLMAGSSIGVASYADMFVALCRARLKARDGKVFELDGLLASIARNRSQFAYLLYGFVSGQHPCGRHVGK